MFVSVATAPMSKPLSLMKLLFGGVVGELIVVTGAVESIVKSASEVSDPVRLTLSLAMRRIRTVPISRAGTGIGFQR